MLKNYITIAFRNLRKNQLYTFLNISGLAVGLAGSILTLLWANDEWSYNKFHTNLSKIHIILQNQTQGGVTYTFTALPGPLAQRACGPIFRKSSGQRVPHGRINF